MPAPLPVGEDVFVGSRTGDILGPRACPGECMRPLFSSCGDTGGVFVDGGEVGVCAGLPVPTFW